MNVNPDSHEKNHRRSNEEIRRDFKFFKDNHDSLLTQYPNQWVAVRGEQVAASASDYRQAEAQLKEQGIPIDDAIWEFMEEERNYLIASNWDADIEEWQISGMISRMRDD